MIYYVYMLRVLLFLAMLAVLYYLIKPHLIKNATWRYVWQNYMIPITIMLLFVFIPIIISRDDVFADPLFVPVVSFWVFLLYNRVGWLFSKPMALLNFGSCSYYYKGNRDSLNRNDLIFVRKFSAFYMTNTHLNKESICVKSISIFAKTTEGKDALIVMDKIFPKPKLPGDDSLKPFRLEHKESVYLGNIMIGACQEDSDSKELVFINKVTDVFELVDEDDQFLVDPKAIFKNKPFFIRFPKEKDRFLDACRVYPMTEESLIESFEKKFDIKSTKVCDYSFHKTSDEWFLRLKKKNGEVSDLSINQKYKEGGAAKVFCMYLEDKYLEDKYRGKPIPLQDFIDDMSRA